MYQTGENAVPFTVKRTLVLQGMKESDKRGGHAHYKTNQILVCVSGECKVDLDDGKEKATVTLHSAGEGLLLPPHFWHVMHSFALGTILLVLTDREYDEKDYIRNYADFIQQL